MKGYAHVVGAGLSGLAAAAGLAQGGWQVTVHERWPEVKAVGTGLGLWPEAMRTLERIGIADELAEVGVAQPGGTIRTVEGRALLRLSPASIRHRFGGDVILISRRRLIETLLRAAAEAGAQVRTGARPDIAELRAEADLLVGADGVGSSVRNALFSGQAAPVASGFWAVRGTDRRTLLPYGETWGRGQIFGVTAVSEGATNWYAAFRADPHQRPTLEEVRERYAGWPEPVPTLLAGAAEEAVLRHAVQHLRPMPRSLVHGNVALVGDAAHAMTPSLGQGGGQSLIDARRLVELVETRDVPGAVAAYDAERRSVTQRYVRASLAMSRLSLASGKTAWIRDHALPLLDRLTTRTQNPQPAK